MSEQIRQGEETYIQDAEKAHMMANAENPYREESIVKQAKAKELISRLGTVATLEDQSRFGTPYDGSVASYDNERLRTAGKAMDASRDNLQKANEEAEKAGSRYDEGQDILNNSY